MSAGPRLPVASRAEKWLPILELGVREVFEIMLGSRLEVPEKSEPLPQAEVMAMVGLAGSLRGVVTFACGQESATLIATLMVGATIAQDEEQVWDAIGEICNMIAGNFKNKLSGLDGICLLSVPAVVTGSAYAFHSLAGGDSLQVTLLLEGSPIVIRVDLHD